jgi:hypothetical protein
MTSNVLNRQHKLEVRNQSIDSEGGYQVRMRKGCLLFATMMALLLQPVVQVVAQDRDKPPAVIVSVASYDKMLADLRYGGDVAGASQYIGLLQFFAGAYAQSIDTTRPAGVLVDFDGPMPVVTAFLPVKNLQRLLDQVADQLGPARDVGDGVKQLDGPQPMFIKESGGFAFLTNSAERLAMLPANPLAALAGAEATYDLSVTVNVPSIPAELREMAIEQIREGYESQAEMQRLLIENEADAELQERLARNGIENIVKLIQQSDTFSLGWAIDPKTQSTYLDVSMTAIEGSELAGHMALLADAKTNFAGLLTPAAVNVGVASTMSADDQEQVQMLLDTVLEKAESEIDADDDLAGDARVAAKDVLRSLMDVAKETVAEGIVDGGVMLMTQADSLQFIAGMRVADGMKLEAAVKRLVELAKDEPDFPEVKLNALQHGGINFHTASLPLPDETARRVFGDSLEVVLGTGPKSFYMSFGSGVIDLLKQSIDTSAQSPNKETLPSFVTVSLTPLLRFGARLEPNNDMLTSLLAALEKSPGKDQISITAQPIPRGFTYRLDIQEGVLRMIGRAVEENLQEGGDF